VKPSNALAHKGAAIEEWIDIHFYRPLGIRLARALAGTRISADEVTLWALVAGLIGGQLFLYSDRRLNALGFVMWVVSDVFDSADGQLARLRGASTRFGRALDGISDSLRFAYLYLCLLLRLLAAGAGWPAVALVVVAVASHSLQATIVDFIRSAYLWAGLGEGSVDLPEDVAAPAEGRWLARVSGRIYRDYVLRQAFVLPWSVRLIRLLRSRDWPAAVREEYRERQQKVLALCPMLGQNLRIALLAVVAATGRPSLFLWTSAVLLNVVVAALVAVHEWNAAALLASLHESDSAYV
jgi:phosphatidylglycerophosphate synthase